MGTSVRQRAIAVLVVACSGVWLVGCRDGAVATRPSSESGAKTASPNRGGEPHRAARADRGGNEVNRDPVREGLVIGEFALAPNPVVDGDTIRVEGFDKSIRLLSIDTEEKIRAKRDRAAIERDFEAYIEAKRGQSRRPTKAATPMGDEATEFAEAFFESASQVRLERDHPKALRGRFGRPLAFAFVKKDGKWTSYNVEAVRAGMTPYFTKYGYSHRFHNQLARAEAEARRDGRGIWADDAKGYGDYEERKGWWDARASFMQAFEHESASREDSIVLSHWDAEARLESRLGQDAALLGDIDGIQHFKGLTRVNLAQADKRNFPIIFRDRDVFNETRISKYVGEPIVVRGKVERYRRGSYETLQIVVSNADQVTVPELPWPEPPRQARRSSETKRAHDR